MRSNAAGPRYSKYCRAASSGSQPVFTTGSSHETFLSFALLWIDPYRIAGNHGGRIIFP
jgi:hypothetical protein